MTKREKALCALIDQLSEHVEDLGCNCPDSDARNRLHSAPGRRRQDSKCTGVSLAVAAQLRKRRCMTRGFANG